MTTMMQNMQFALRQLRRSPGFTLVAVVIMALGIGANTAIFSVVHAVLLEPLPFGDIDPLVQVWHTPPQASFPGMKKFSVSPANFLDWQKQSAAFEKMALYSGTRFDVTGAGKPEAVTASSVSPEFFPVLGAKPLHGRTFLSGESGGGHDRVVVLSYKFWQTHYGADAGAVGRTIRLDGEPYTIVGVMGPAMTKPEFAQMWVPLALTPAEKAVRSEHNFRVLGKMKPGVTLKQAQSEMDTISQRLERAYPGDDKGWGALVVPLREETVGDIRPALLMMLGAVAFVLLIACANVANLVLARTFARRKEIAIRTAMGATRPRIVQQLLSETVLLALFGGVVGLVVAHFGIELLLKYFADNLPRMGEIGLSLPVLAFTLAVSVVTGILSGLIPALRMSKGDINEALKQGLGRTDADGGGRGMRSALVVMEVALSLVLLVGAGLMIRSLWKLQTIDPGFDEHHVLTMSVKVGKKQFTSADQEAQFFDQVQQRVRALPGVEHAGAVDDLPLVGGSNQPVAIEGHAAASLSEQPEVSVRVATAGYFKTMRIPLLEGRDISADDTANSAPVVVISQSMAKQFWPDGSPVGHHLKLSFYPDKDREIVGVVGDVKQDGLDSSVGIATLYWPLAQTSGAPAGPWMPRSLSLVVRTAGEPRTLATAVTAAIQEINKDVPVDNVLTMEEFVGETLTQRSFNMQLLAIFGLLALVLCTGGIYSVLAYSVRRGMKEIGLRIAFGATKADVLRVVVARGMKPTVIGIAIGLIAAIALGRVATSMIYGVSSRDLATFTSTSVTILLMLVALGASIFPALRATRVDPLVVLRDE
ncbi:ABC transporter permease [Edaphobacter modestus]|uniref:Putative permease n=1 Tax=Edaphobacter modestus TaxID=388466 RepID=A0A4Q7YZ48_9BACT|nr:ABC transporter permease [Edaphobacter modestus]RZU43272.1 putative permease [Edaphobacter modestus]